jgi:uncharacterized protein YbaP (TraB family)
MQHPAGYLDRHAVRPYRHRFCTWAEGHFLAVFKLSMPILVIILENRIGGEIKMKKLLLSMSLVVLFCSQSFADSSVWKVQKDDTVLFLGGTFHILRQSDFPLPEEFEQAYSLSDILVFETNIAKLYEYSTQQKLMMKAMYPDGSTVDSHLSAKTYAMLDDYCTTNSLPLAQLKMFKPSIITVSIATIELTKIGAAQEGVDMFFYKLAQNDQKAIEGLETVDEQIDYIVGMGKGNEDALVKYTIDDLKTIKQKYQIMVDAWKTGDSEKLYQLVVSSMKSKMPGLHQTLIVDRNDKWLPRINTYLQTPEKEFILVGAAHLIGPEGIIETLRKSGYSVEKL